MTKSKGERGERASTKFEQLDTLLYYVCLGRNERVDILHTMGAPVDSFWSCCEILLYFKRSRELLGSGLASIGGHRGAAIDNSIVASDCL